jgi:hypothetical protein
MKQRVRRVVKLEFVKSDWNCPGDVTVIPLQARKITVE